MSGLLWIDSPYAPWSFLLVTVVLGGAAAFTAGRALAQTWRPLWQAFAYAAALAAAAGFLHFVLFGEPTIPGARIAALVGALPVEPGAAIAGLAAALRHYAVICVTLCGFAAFGYRLTRARAMQRQYGFEVAPSGPLSWRERA
ncbi:MAG: DUF6867 family protein [Beijerinckiaceae bacterium]